MPSKTEFTERLCRKRECEAIKKAADTMKNRLEDTSPSAGARMRTGESRWSNTRRRGADRCHEKGPSWRFLGLLLMLVALTKGSMVVSEVAAMEADETKTTIGRLENVWIREADIIFKAKIDTGTQTSSLNVRDLEIFAKGGEVWARFVIDAPDGTPVKLERQVLRFARFKKQGQEVDRRPIVILGLCIGDVFRRTEVNLTDRARFTYPLLIGRRFLSGAAVVDTEKKFTSPPQCAEMNKKR